MQKLRGSGISFIGSIAASRLKVVNSWTAVQETYLNTKDVFEKHKVVFTVGTSVASVATACIGYSLRHYHDVQVDRRLESIEQAVSNKQQLEHSKRSKMVNSGGISGPACFATAGTTFIVGYGLGWRGGRLFAIRQIKREQMKMMGHVKPRIGQFLTKLKSKCLDFRFRRSFSRKAGMPESGSQKRDKIPLLQPQETLGESTSPSSNSTIRK